MSEKRMTLDAISRGVIERPFRIALYGIEGIGKTTFGAGAPGAVFLASEDGTHHLDVARFPQPHTWTDVLDALSALFQDDHAFETLVVDSVDWLQILAEDEVCREQNVRALDEIGFGKWKGFLVGKLREFLLACDALHKSRGMNIVLIGHAEIRRFSDPERDDYDRYSLKALPAFAALIREWCDALLFANYDATIVKDQGGFGKKKAKSFGKRLIFTNHSAAFDAKNRFGLPDRLPLSWDAFQTAVRGGEISTPVNPIEGTNHEQRPF